MIALLAPATVWLQYAVLAIPMLFALSRQRWTLPIAAAGAAMLAIEPVEMLVGRSLVPNAVMLTAPAPRGADGLPVPRAHHALQSPLYLLRRQSARLSRDGADHRRRGRSALWHDEIVETHVRAAAAGEKRTHYAEVHRRQTRNCVDPWNMAFVQSNGGVRPCCFIDSSFGQLPAQSLGEIIEGGPFLRLRKQLLTGELRPSCAACPAREVVDVSVLEQRVRALQS